MGAASDPSGVGRSSAATPRFAALKRWLPPARLVWIFLLVLGGYSLLYLNGLGLTPLVVLPLIAVVVDLAFQRVRFERLRLPDAAIATGLFVALVLPPIAPLLYTGIAVFVAVATRHILRYSGRPWFNPAAGGILLAAFMFGLAPAWWAGVGPLGEYLVVALGIALIVRSPAQWRTPVTFLVAYAFLATLQHVILGATTDPRILFLQATDPTTVFFALFMVAEPRTSPSSPAAQPLVAGAIGTLTAFAPLFAPAVGPLLALLAGNLLTLGLRRAERARVPALASPSRPRRKIGPARSPAGLRWTISRRAAAALLVGTVLLGAVSAVPVHRAQVILVGSVPTGGLGGAGGGSAGCTTNNTSIPASTLQQLHKLLGPSVILAYNGGQGSVVFYDPVNHVTVTETDLYEDFGFAEFNGDDYAVSGCAG